MTPTPIDLDALAREIKAALHGWCNQFVVLVADIERQPGEWGHMRQRVVAELSAAACRFRTLAPQVDAALAQVSPTGELRAKVESLVMEWHAEAEKYRESKSDLVSTAAIALNMCAVSLAALLPATAPTCATCRHLGQWRQHYARCSHPRVPVQTLTQDKSAEFGCVFHEPKPTGGAQ